MERNTNIYKIQTKQNVKQNLDAVRVIQFF